MGRSGAREDLRHRLNRPFDGDSDSRSRVEAHDGSRFQRSWIIRDMACRSARFFACARSRHCAVLRPPGGCAVHCRGRPSSDRALGLEDPDFDRTRRRRVHRNLLFSRRLPLDHSGSSDRRPSPPLSSASFAISPAQQFLFSQATPAHGFDLIARVRRRRVPLGATACAPPPLPETSWRKSPLIQ